jgi:uncharacterized NAD(P)/FAD-binding protein YdhS
MTDRFETAIIGNGVSGTLLAIRLARLGRTGVALIGPQPPGRGLAYETPDAEHLLNVAAGRMSLFPEDPQNFVRWLAEASGLEPPPGPGDFVPRSLYGDYVQARLAEAGGTRTVSAEITGLDREGAGFRLTHAGGSFFARQVVLALGNFPPRWPGAFAAHADDPRLLGNPWDVAREAALPADARILLLGTGLTMVDVALTLLGSGHGQPITALSRHGLLPQPHLVQRQPAPVISLADLPADPRGLLIWLRRNTRGQEDWRPYIDALRPVTQSLWSRWDEAARAAFCRHLRAFWDVHRHRLAPKVALRLTAEQQAGRLGVRAGRVTVVTAAADGIRVATSDGWQGEFDAIVNCTGPAADPRQGTSPLLTHMLAQGLVEGHPFGLLTDADGAVTVGGQARPGLFALGPLCRPALWEITAVPDIRTQVAALAARLTA